MYTFGIVMSFCWIRPLIIITLFACNSFLCCKCYYSLILPFRHFTLPQFSINVCIYIFFLYFQPTYVVELKVKGFVLFFFNQQLIFRSFFFEVHSSNLCLLISAFRHSRLMQLLVCWHLNLPYCFVSLSCHSSVFLSLHSCGLPVKC